jgi:hypothetical protein
MTVRNVACWDGSSWSTLGDGVPFLVRAMTVFQGRLVAAGNAASPEAQGGIAEWNGTIWQPLGDGVTGTTSTAGIQALLPLDDRLYAGGVFTQAGLQSARNVAQWNGTQWSPVGDGPPGAAVTALASFGHHLAAASAELSIWDGTAWTVNTAADLRSPTSLASSGSDLMALGNSLNPVSGGSQTVILLRNDSIILQGLGYRGTGLPEFHTMVPSPKGVILGGAFRAGLNLWECLALWDGRTWNSLDRGLNYPPTGLRVQVRSVATSADEIIAGGFFPWVGTQQFNHIARWDGTRWLPMGDGIASTVNAVAYYGDRILAATDGAGVLVWNGRAWHSLGVPPPLHYQTLAVSGETVFAAGVTKLGNPLQPPTGVMVRWDGNAWSEIASNLPPQPTCLYHDGHQLYAGGRFTEIQGVPARGIASWDGRLWTPVAGGLAPAQGSTQLEEIRAITSDGTGRLFVGGTFLHAASQAANVALIEDDAWHPLGSGVTSQVTAMAWWNGGLLVGGHFHLAGGKTARALGLWNRPRSSLEIDLHAPRRVAPDEGFDVRLLLRHLPGTDHPPATVRLVIPPGSTFVSAENGGTESSGVITWSLDNTLPENLAVACRLRAPSAETLINFNAASVEISGQDVYLARPHATTVAAPATPPLVRLTQPNLSPTVRRTPILLEAEVDSGASTPASVEFFAGTTKIATALSAPWRAEWQTPVAGTTELRAMLVDTAGRSVTSLPVRIELRDPPVNDHFADRIPLPPPARETFRDGVRIDADPFGATAEAGEPAHGPEFPAQRSLWWSFLPPADGHVSFTVSREGMHLQFYSGSDLAHLTPLYRTSHDHGIPVQKNVPYTVAVDFIEGLDVHSWTFFYHPAGGQFARNFVVLPNSIEFYFESPDLRECTLEGSTNLVDWRVIMSFQNSGGWNPIVMPLSTEPGPQFFRVR